MKDPDLCRGFYLARQAVRTDRAGGFVLCLEDETNLAVYRRGSDFLFRFDESGEGSGDEACTDLLASPGQRKITMLPGSSADISSLRHYLADQVIPRLLAEEGALVMHAGAVVIDGRAHLFAGPSGIGKSTLCAGLAREGATILSDDALILRQSDGRWLAEAVYPGLRLLPDAMDGLNLAASERAGVASYTDKQRILSGIRLLEATGGDSAVPLAGVYVLTGDDSADIAILPLSQASALIALLAQTFAADARSSAPQRMRQVTGLLRDLPAGRLTSPRRFDIFPALYQVLKVAGDRRP